MRFKITLEVVPDVFGTVLPISYQHELSIAVARLLQSNAEAYTSWLASNGFTPEDAQQMPLYSVSNLYVPKIYVKGDRLQINVPRVQFWISFFPESGTKEYLERVALGQDFVLGDQKSRVMFRVTSIDDVTPVQYQMAMDYQTLSPVVVLGVRPNKSVEYLSPQNRYFAEFMVQGLIERWEFLHRAPYMGERRFSFQMLGPERRKLVSSGSGSLKHQKVIGYMMKFRLKLDPQLQEVAYVGGIGDRIEQGFGYLELLDKSNK